MILFKNRQDLDDWNWIRLFLNEKEILKYKYNDKWKYNDIDTLIKTELLLSKIHWK